MKIEGSGGAGKGFGAAAINTGAFSGFASNDVLRSKATARLIDIVSEGQIVGLLAGLKSVFFDDIPVEQSDGTANYENISVSQRFGTPDQDPLVGYSSSEQETIVGSKVVKATPILVQISDTDVDSARLTVRVPALYSVDTSGNIFGQSLQFKVETKLSSEPDSAYEAIAALGTNYLGYTFKLTIPDNFFLGVFFPRQDFFHTVASKTDTVDDIGQAFADILNTDSRNYYATTATWTSATKTLLVSDGAVDNRGTDDLSFNTATPGNQPVPLFVESIEDLGAPGDDLSITFTGDGIITIVGKADAPYEEQYRVQRPTGTIPWVIRVTRLSPDDDPNPAFTITAFDLFVQSYTEIIENKLIYPDSALMGLTVDSQSFGGKVPRRSYDIRGLIINVPTNYDPETRIYTGIWDGTFKLAWTDNPAWVVYDLLIDRRYGLGEFIDAADVDKFRLFTIGQVCDELVDNGEGQQEPRFTFNGVINSADDAFKVVNAFCSTFQGMPFWAAGQVTFTQDAIIMPEDVSSIIPTRLVGTANVEDGLFNYTGSSLNSRTNRALVSFNDPDDSYRLAIQTIEDTASIDSIGVREVNVAAFGCTSRGQAARLGKWIIETAQNETQIVSYVAGTDHADVVPGEVIGISDPSLVGARLSGRIIAVSGTTVTLDQPYAFTAGDALQFMTSLDDVEEINITAAGGGPNDVVLSTAPSTTAENAVFIIKQTAVEPKLWRVITVTEEDEGTKFNVTALELDVTKFARIEQDLHLTPSPTSLFPKGALLAPTNLSVRDDIVKVNNKIVSRITVSWTPSTDPRALVYRLQVKPPNTNNWEGHSFSPPTSQEIFEGETGLWSFRVTALSSVEANSNESPALELRDVSILGKSAPPDDVQNLTAARRADGVQLSWDAVEDLDLIGYDIRQGSGSWETATIVAERFVGTTIFVELDTSSSITFQIRARDELNILSTIIASIVTAIADLLPVDLATFQAYNIGSRLKFVWNPISIPGTGINYELRRGVNWPDGVLLGETAGGSFTEESSVTVITNDTYIIRPFIEFSDGGRIYGPETAKIFQKLPRKGGALAPVSGDEAPGWAGVKVGCSVVGLDLIMDANVLEATYQFAKTPLLANRFGRVFFNQVNTSLPGAGQEINVATQLIFGSDEPLAADFTDTLQIEIFSGNPTPDVPFKEADYDFNTFTAFTQNYLVKFTRQNLDDVRPGLSNLVFSLIIPTETT